MKKYLLLLSVLLRVGNSQCMLCGEWRELSVHLREEARRSALIINQANADLRAEAQSRNVLTISLPDKQEVVLFSGVSPFKQFATLKNRKYFSFIDVLIGKIRADVLFNMANTSKEIIASFQKEFRTLRTSVTKLEGIERTFLIL